MSDLLPSTLTQPSAPPSPPVKLWTPRAVGMTTFFLGFPGGIVLASINWMRMGLKNKVISLLIAGVIGLFVFDTLEMFHLGGVETALALVFNISMVWYLQNRTKKDVESFRANNHDIQNANGFVAFLIGLGMLAIYFALSWVLGFLTGFALAILRIPLP